MLDGWLRKIVLGGVAAATIVGLRFFELRSQKSKAAETALAACEQQPNDGLKNACRRLVVTEFERCYEAALDGGLFAYRVRLDERGLARCLAMQAVPM